MRGLFITATDTDVGKTLVTAALLRLVRKADVDAMVFKPIQSGTPAGDAWDKNLRAPDVLKCLAAAKLTPTDDELPLLCPYQYQQACSPHLAGRMAGKYADIDRIADCAKTLLTSRDALLVEGAGGTLVPINENQTMLDIMTRLAMPVLLVARGSLGTINHTLLSLETLRRAGLEVIGVVINDAPPGDASPEQDDFIRRDNPKAIASFGDVKILADIPFIPGLATEKPDQASWRAVEKTFTDIDTILDALK